MKNKKYTTKERFKILESTVATLYVEIINKKLVPISCEATTKFKNDKIITKYSYILEDKLCKKI